jgi:hypothetical protein
MKDTIGECRPVVLTYFSPERHNPYGTSLYDLTEDKQRSLSKLLNLQIAKATRDSFGNDIFYDSSVISNSAQFTELSVDPKAIPLQLQP